MSVASALRQRTLCKEADSHEEYALQLLLPPGEAKDCIESLSKSANKYGKSFKFKKTGWATSSSLAPEKTGAGPNAVWDSFYCHESTPYVSLELGFSANPQERTVLEARIADALLGLHAYTNLDEGWELELDSVASSKDHFYCRWNGCQSAGLVSAQAKPTPAITAVREVLRKVLADHARDAQLGAAELSGLCAPVALHDIDTIPIATLSGFVEELLKTYGNQRFSCTTLALVRLHGDQAHQVCRTWNLTESMMALAGPLKPRSTVRPIDISSKPNSAAAKARAAATPSNSCGPIDIAGITHQAMSLQKQTVITGSEIARQSSLDNLLDTFKQYDGHMVLASESMDDIDDAKLDACALMDQALKWREARQDDFWTYKDHTCAQTTVYKPLDNTHQREILSSDCPVQNAIKAAQP